MRYTEFEASVLFSGSPRTDDSDESTPDLSHLTHTPTHAPLGPELKWDRSTVVGVYCPSVTRRTIMNSLTPNSKQEAMVSYIN